MKVLLGNSYFLSFDPKLWQEMRPYPPLGTLYAASFIRQQGHSVILFDATLAESVGEWEQQLSDSAPSVAVLFEDNFNYLSKMCLLHTRQAAFRMIASAKRQGCFVVSAGADSTDHAQLYLDAGADTVLIGEGEQTLADLLMSLEGGSPQRLADVPGIAYLQDGRMVRSSPRPIIKAVDDLPFPAWDLVDVTKYRRIWRQRHGYFSMNMVTTRGCPYHCNWCAKPIWGQRYQARSPENVIDEMGWLQESYRPDHIWFADDIMGLKPGWWRQFAALAEQRQVRIPFKCLSRADLIVRDRAELKAMKNAGCEIVWIGAESGSQRVLDAMEKGITVEQIGQAARSLREVGIQVAFFLQFGYPGETREDIELTLQMVRDLAPDDIGVSVSYPLPGTRFYENVRSQLGAKQNWSDSADLDMMYLGPFSTAFYRQLHLVLHTEFRARRAMRLHRPPASLSSARKRQTIRDILASLYRWVRLPFARRKLDQLSRTPHHGLTTLPHMALERAAQPSPQGD